jgi:hypothetical protein
LKKERILFLLVIFFMNPMECSSVFERNSLAIDKSNASGCFECLWAYPSKGIIK